MEACFVIRRAVQRATPKISAGIAKTQRSTATCVIAGGLAEVQAGFAPVVRTAIRFHFTDARVARRVGGSGRALGNRAAIALGTPALGLAIEGVRYARLIP